MTGRGDPKVLVAGGGIIGCAVARELSGCGCQVILLERNRVGAEASSAAAGILSPQPDSIGPSPLLDLGLESLRLYADFVSALRNETGIDPEFGSRGTLLLNLTREDEMLSRALCHWRRRRVCPWRRYPPGRSAVWNLDWGVRSRVGSSSRKARCWIPCG